MGFLRFVASVMVSAVFGAVIICTLPFARGDALFYRITDMWARTLVRICGIRIDLRGKGLLQPRAIKQENSVAVIN